ncbi:hypothetical protein H7F51_15535 [Novosphingobium flavum]|uniref:DUF2029 domain-containing protein n=1 Tax=Novosphingobium flavum TaxID=1778672 RepID=A0A7X1KN29_9SPHN|nr:hypothetical protein [Novosphingobium flavum]MBC2666930.1 hypothetical protein [Novosphingobium flavum]
MDHADVRSAALKGARAPQFDRFAHWPRGLARIALAVFAVLLVMSAWAPGYAPPPPAPPKITVKDAAGKAHVQKEDDNDLHLYRVITERVRKGDNYYVAATDEQRANSYPVAPGLTVRLPTLAFAGAYLGTYGLIALQIVLFAAMMIAMLRRLQAEPGSEEFRMLALALLMTGIASGLSYKYNVLHEIWAAQLVALSLALHRPDKGKWLGALIAAALALAVRELALPFVFLMLAYALWHRRWREAAAWTALVVLFLAAMAVHLHFAQAQVRADDPVSPPWLVLGGLNALVYKVANSTFLSLLPVWITGPAVVLCLFGWTAWKSPLGDFAALLMLGYSAAFMIAGRDNNFYWGVMITPVLFMGAAFVRLGLPSLWRAAGLGLPALRRAREPLGA